MRLINSCFFLLLIEIRLISSKLNIQEMDDEILSNIERDVITQYPDLSSKIDFVQGLVDKQVVDMFEVVHEVTQHFSNSEISQEDSLSHKEFTDTAGGFIPNPFFKNDEREVKNDKRMSNVEMDENEIEGEEEDKIHPDLEKFHYSLSERISHSLKNQHGFILEFKPSTLNNNKFGSNVDKKKEVEDNYELSSLEKEEDEKGAGDGLFVKCKDPTNFQICPGTVLVFFITKYLFQGYF